MSHSLELLKQATNAQVREHDDGGRTTVAARDFAKGEVIFQESPLALVFPSQDAPWLAAMRKELTALNSSCNWQYCLAVHCLPADALPQPAPQGLVPFGKEEAVKLEDLCGLEEITEPSELAACAASHLLEAARSQSATAFRSWSEAQGADVASRLGVRLDDIAARVSRNGFQIVDLDQRPPTAADGLFHRISFLNHCCANLNSASWTFTQGLLTVRAARDVRAGEELTISYIAKPWSDLAKPARRRYLLQNFNFVCLCQACVLPQPRAPPEDTAQDDAKSNKGNLAGLLLRWLQDEREDLGEDNLIDEPDLAPKPATPKIAVVVPKTPLTDDDRIQRVLQRCSAEGLEASRDEAARALEEEQGHVGRALILLRRKQRSVGEACA